MLVLSRKTNQTILFPNLGINVEILRVAGSSVSVGIKAPSSVQILRGELARGALQSEPAQSSNMQGDTVASEPLKLPHAIRNQLHKAHLTVALAQKQIQMGKTEDAEKTLEEMLQLLQRFDDALLTMSAEAPRDDVATSSGDSDRGLRRALVVEDDANERKLLAAYLRLCGMTVLEAADGIEAIHLLRSHSVDLIVLDMHMPRLNGVDTLRSLRKLPKLRRTKVIVVSGEPPEHSDYAEIKTDVSEWFAKPLDPAHLVQRIQPNSGSCVPART